MSRVGNCWDNAPVESFFSGLKAEAIPIGGYRSPMDYERDRGMSL